MSNAANLSYGIVIQFLVMGFGDDEDFERRVQIEGLIGEVLEADNNGGCTGGDGGSGTMNAFFTVNDPARAKESVLSALRQAGHLDEGLVVVQQTFREDDDELPEEIWWPTDYAFTFSTFGPIWNPQYANENLNSLSEGLRILQGDWSTLRYDAGDGADTSDWARQLRVFFARDQLMVRHGVAVISASRISSETIGEIDVRPIMGPNKGRLSLGRFGIRGDELHLCIYPPEEGRPDGIAPSEEEQPGRMILRRT